MSQSEARPLMRKIDCLQLPVPDLEAGLAFYCGQLGHTLIWRTATAAGLRLPESDSELVLQTERTGLEVDFLVDDADRAALAFQQAGGRIVVPPFAIPIGRAVVVADPWGNALVLLDARHGALITDDEKRVIGVKQKGINHAE